MSISIVRQTGSTKQHVDHRLAAGVVFSVSGSAAFSDQVFTKFPGTKPFI